MLRLIIILVLAMSIPIFSQDMPGEDAIGYRPPTVAGAFYPADADSLRAMVNKYLNTSVPGRYGYYDIKGLVAPHAGYIYSGKVAGGVYKEIKDKKYDVAIIIAPSHHESFRGASVFNGDAYVTPLGNVMVDKELAKEIADYDDRILYSMNGHRWKGVTPEHSLEVQLPFLQVVQPEIRIVPIVMGTQDFLTQDLLMRALVNALKKTDKNYLLIASTDLSHFHSADTAEAMDKALVRTFMRFDYFALQNLISMGVFEACGGGPLVTVMMTAEQLGAARSQATMYTHSGRTEAGKSRQDRVVGYFGGIILKTDFMPELTPELSYNNKVRLMEKVKKIVANVARGNDTLDFFGMVPRDLAQFAPVFVTLKERGELRACMGHTFAQNPLIVEAQEAAKLAATSDYRFGAISQEELDSLQFEITVMSRMRRILDFKEIEIGKDGLLIRLGANRGLLLPQVASERNWDVETFLQNLCLKAGLPADAYKNPDAQIFAFRALIIDESDLKE